MAALYIKNSKYLKKVTLCSSTLPKFNVLPRNITFFQIFAVFDV